MSSWGNTDTLASAPVWITNKKTFDGTQTSIVDLTNNNLNIRGHGLITGDPVVYTSTGAITGLTSGTTYYAIRVDADTVALASSVANAQAGTKIDITAVGTATNDTIMKAPTDLYFVDITEANVASNRAKGLKSPGWWKYSTYTDNEGETRHRAELLVALPVTSAVAGDANDDAVVADA